MPDFEKASADELAAFKALSEREKMVKGLAYLALDDKKYNNHPFNEWREDFELSDFYGPDSRLQHLADLFKIPLERTRSIGIEPPLYVDYGYNIEFKGDFYANFGAVFLDCAKISFGERMVMGPGYERAYPVELGDDMWIGGGVKIIGPCKIGNNCTIAAGAVVKGDFPDNVVIGGCPARILKHLDPPKGPIDPEDRRLVVPLPGAKSAAKNDISM
ncbi:hypothetical protein JCM8115_006840 [Rhodotorula mucilaginosa]|uniref:Maltose acetyltransferase n=1 Tax=Rhodotorula mucilaginosa TaxID=5537 RepID=A0A9P6W343_RHOMI|nr:Maltose acetyltransferase [Rhodotorula mucilaginosa]